MREHMTSNCIHRSSSGRANVRATLLVCGAAASIAVMAPAASAQFVWTGATTGSFSDSSKWLGGSVPVSGPSTTLTFSPGAPAAAVTATQNIGTPFQVNGVTFNNMSVANGLTINGTSGNTFQVAGTSPTYTLQGAGLTTFSATGATTQLASNLTFAGSGMGNVTVSGAISETGGARSLTINTTPATQASGLVTLGVASTFSGGVNLNSGNLALAGFTPNAAGTGPFTVGGSGGVLSIGSSSIVFGSGVTMTLNAPLRLFAVTVGLTVNSTLSGSSPLTLNGTTLNGFVLSSATGYTGVVTADRFDLPQMATSASGVQLTGTNGTMTAVPTFNIRAGNTLWANNTSSGAAANLDRINNSATINLASAFLQVGGTGSVSAAQTNVTEVVGTVNAAGFTTLQSTTNSGSTRSTVINVNTALNRSDRGTMLFRGSGLGGAAGSLSANVTPNGDGSQNFDGTAATSYIVVPGAMVSDLVGGGGAAGSSTISILPYAVGDAATTNTGVGSTFVTLDAISGSASRNVRPLAVAEYNTPASDAAFVAVGATENVRLNAPRANAGSLTMNALLLTNNSTTSDGSVTGSGTLNITSGAILSGTSNAAATISNNIAFGAAEGNIFTPGFGGLNITGNMTGSNGLTKSGGGTNNNTLFLTGDNTGLTGQLTINAGAVNFNSANALPGTGQIVTNGTNVSTSGGAVGLFYSGTSGGVTIARDVAANSGWLTFKTTDNTGTAGTLTLSGKISGNAAISLQTTGAADIYITRTDNSYTGPTSISTGANAFGAGKVHINGDGAFGTGGALNIAGYVVLEGDWNSSRHINNGGMTIDTNGHNATLSGPMTNFSSGSITSNFANAAFTKNGAGSLTITSNANQLGGPITVNTGSLIVNGTIAGSTTNAVSVASGATLGGSGTIYRNVSVASGGTLAPGSSAGNLTMFGNATLASGSALSVELNGTVPGSEYDVLTVNGGVSLAGASLNTSLGFAPAGGEMFFIVVNDGTDAITGTFAGLPDMAPITLTYLSGTYDAQISYFGDAATGAINGGNDIVIIIPAPAAGTGLLAFGSLALARRRRR